MTSITEGLLGQLQGNSISQIGQRLGISPGMAATAVSAALPLIIGALGRNSRQPQGAQSLFNALQRDHANQDVNSALGSSFAGTGQGGEILGHIFGPRQQVAAQGLGAATGLAPDNAHMLLRWLAPVALAYVAKRMYDHRTAGAASGSATGSATPGTSTTSMPPSPEVLGQVLGHEEEQISRQGGIGGGLLGAVLDRNHDGKVDFSDLMGGRA